MADHQQVDQTCSTKGIERKLVEKNRRKHMKDLCSKLNSLLPNNNNSRKGALSRADQIDEVINYIKNLETNVKMAQEKKESLMERKKRSRSDDSSSFEPPKIEIHEMGSSLQIILTYRFDYQFFFSEIIRILHEENIEIKSAHSSLAGNSMLHVVHAQTQESFQRGTAAMSIERLKRFVNGHGRIF